MDEIRENLKRLYLKLKYKGKYKELNISSNMMDGLLNRLNMEEVIGILNVISKSKNKEEFRNNIVEFCKRRKKIYITNLFLFGNITGNYSMFDTSNLYNEGYNYENFNNSDYINVLSILRDRFYEYLLMKNEEKNKFLIDEKGNYNYTLDLNKDFCLKIFDDTIKGIRSNSSIKYVSCYSIVREYINDMIGIYGKEIIENDFEFILYDLNSKKNLSLEERRKKYLEKSKLSNDQKYKIDNIEILINRLKTINNRKASELLERINDINDREENISEIEDIYMEYEILLREDIISHLYVPNNDCTVVEDYKDLKPQLIHMFIRNPEKFRTDIEKRIKEEIIGNRIDKNNNSMKLTEEEQLEYEKRMELANAMLDPTVVNYTYDGREFMYSDKNGFNSYHSDTSNQISASIYSEKYYLNYFFPWCIGIGFNKGNVMPEAIAISSSQYLTTNMGLNNLEYDQSREFELMSSPYSELINNDGKSEVVLFRRNIDYDTKASYIFVTVDSRDKKRCEEIITTAREMSEKNNLKLVIYDLYKIKKSYEASLSSIKGIYSEEESCKVR